MSCQRRRYTRQLLDLYCGLPETAARRPSPYDRQLADQLYDQNIPLELVQAAFLIAMARRKNRDPQAPTLPIIRSLAYFLPLIEELRIQPPSPDYLRYLRSRTTD